MKGFGVTNNEDTFLNSSNNFFLDWPKSRDPIKPPAISPSDIFNEGSLELTRFTVEISENPEALKTPTNALTIFPCPKIRIGKFRLSKTAVLPPS